MTYNEERRIAAMDDQCGVNSSEEGHIQQVTHRELGTPRNMTEIVHELTRLQNDSEIPEDNEERFKEITSLLLDLALHVKKHEDQLPRR